MSDGPTFGDLCERDQDLIKNLVYRDDAAVIELREGKEDSTPLSVLLKKIGAALLLVLLCALPMKAQTTASVTGTIQDLGTNTVSNNTFVRLYLRGCNGNPPRINGTAIIAPTLGNVYYKDFVPNSSGVISGTIYATRDSTGLLGGSVECGGSKTSEWYGLTICVNGKCGPESAIQAKAGSTIDLSNITPITTNPVVTAPTGDSTYARLDGGNQNFTGPIGAPYSTMGAYNVSTRGDRQIILQNAVFEGSSTIPPPGWTTTTPANISYETVSPDPGKAQSIKITSTGAQTTLVSTNIFSVAGGDTYSVTFDVNTDGVGTAQAFLITEDKNGVTHATSLRSATISSIGWQTVTFSGTVNSSNGIVQAFVQLENTNTSGSVWFDQITVQKTHKILYVGTGGGEYSSIAACYAALPAAVYTAYSDGIDFFTSSGGGTCFVPAYWTETLTANLVLANGKSIYFQGPAVINMSTFQVTAAGGVHGAAIVGMPRDNKLRGSGVVWDYTGSGDAFAIGDGITSVDDIVLDGLQIHCLDGGTACQPLDIKLSNYGHFTHLDLVIPETGSPTGKALVVNNGEANYFEDIRANPTIQVTGGSVRNSWILSNAATSTSQTYGIDLANAIDNYFFGTLNEGSGTSYSGAYFHFGASSTGNEVFGPKGFSGGTTTTAVFDSGSSFNLFHCVGGGCVFTDNNSPSTTNQVFDSGRNASAEKLTLGADVAATNLIASASPGRYRASLHTMVTRVGTVSSTLPTVCVLWTDKDNSTSENWSAASVNTNLLTTYQSTVTFFTAKSGTAIQYATGANCPGGTTYATSGATSMQYKVEVVLEGLQ